jgi:hypothetical protein
MGQMVEIDPLQMKAVHAATTAALVRMDPGNQLGDSSFL